MEISLGAKQQRRGSILKNSESLSASKLMRDTNSKKREDKKN